MSPSPPQFQSAASSRAPVAATIATVIRGRAVLLVRRANRPDALRWGFPGGKINVGEAIEHAALRELYEETGVRAEARKVFTALDAFDRDEGGALRRHFILIAVLCRWRSGHPRARSDALDARWFRLEDLRSANLAMSFGVSAVAREAMTLIDQAGNKTP